MQLTDREQKLVNACIDYAENNAEAGLPGHNLMILINKFSEENAMYQVDLEDAKRTIADLKFQLESINK